MLTLFPIWCLMVGSEGTWFTKPIDGKLECCCCCCDWDMLCSCWAGGGIYLLLPGMMRFLGAAFRIPSKILMSKTLGGRSSILASTNTRHSGQRNSLWVCTISSKHFLQNVCWQGSTLLYVSNRSKQTEHSSKSFRVHSSIINTISMTDVFDLLKFIVW